MAPRILLARHGDTAWESVADRGLRGAAADLAPLTPAGRREAERLGEALAGRDVARIVASPMTRALQTAQIVAQRLSLPVEVDLDLREWAPSLQGDWDGGEEASELLLEMRRHGGEWPEGERRRWEPLSSVRRRVALALLRHAGDGLLLAVAHAVVIEAVTGRYALTATFVELAEPPDPEGPAPPPMGLSGVFPRGG